MGRPVHDLTNQVFGRLTALRRVGKTKHGAILWLCRCSCDGKEIEVVGGRLTWGGSMSCGCYARELSSVRLATRNSNYSREDQPAFKHGHNLKNSPTYRSWHAMKQRCAANPNTDHWIHYGGAGVTICERWRGKHGFSNFLADMGERPKGTTLGRYGDVGNYELGNVAWMTDREQKAEQKAKVLIFGHTVSPEAKSANRKTLHIRWHVNRGISNPECALCQVA